MGGKPHNSPQPKSVRPGAARNSLFRGLGPGPPPSSCVTLPKSPNFSKPPSPWLRKKLGMPPPAPAPSVRPRSRDSGEMDEPRARPWCARSAPSRLVSSRSKHSSVHSTGSPMRAAGTPRPIPSIAVRAHVQPDPQSRPLNSSVTSRCLSPPRGPYLHHLE